MDDQPEGAASADEALKLLLEGHGQIREFLALARRIADAAIEAPDSVPEAAVRAQRYFARVMPLHARDEEDSVLPRLRGRDPALDEALDAMAREHHEEARRLASLAAACEEIARVPSRLSALARHVIRATEELERHYADHLAREESLIFPAIARLLDASETAAIVREIRERRVGAGPIVPSDPAPAAPSQ